MKQKKISIELLVGKQEQYMKFLKDARKLPDDRSGWYRDLLNLHVELGELMNEWHIYKYWHEPGQTSKQKQLEEYADGLAMICNLILRYKSHLKEVITAEYTFPTIDQNQITIDYITLEALKLFDVVSMLRPMESVFTEVIDTYLRLGAMLGFTWDEILKSYIKMNKKRYDRLGIKL